MMKCKTCGEMNCMEHGGEVKEKKMPPKLMKKDEMSMKPSEHEEEEDGDMEGEDEMHHAIAGELMDSLEKKDKKGILDAIRAIALSSGGKI